MPILGYGRCSTTGWWMTRRNLAPTQRPVDWVPILCWPAASRRSSSSSRGGADRSARIPPLLVAVCGTVPLLPGSAINHGLFSIVAEADIPGGFAALVEASTVGLPFAAAVVLATISTAGHWEPGSL